MCLSSVKEYVRVALLHSIAPAVVNGRRISSSDSSIESCRGAIENIPCFWGTFSPPLFRPSREGTVKKKQQPHRTAISSYTFMIPFFLAPFLFFLSNKN